MYAYIKPSTESQSYIDHLMKIRFAKHPDQVTEMLPKAKKEFFNRLNEVISEAIDDLSEMVLSDLYQATDKKVVRYVEKTYVPREVSSSPEGFTITYREPKTTYLKKTLRSGVMERRVIKGMGAGRPPEWNSEKLTTVVTRAAKRIAKHNRQSREKRPLTLNEVVKELNVKRDPKAALSENALKKLLGHYEVDWLDIKRAIIGR